MDPYSYAFPGLLLVGRPGSGKTTLLRDLARLLADELDRSVLLLDAFSEVAGEGGGARVGGWGGEYEDEGGRGGRGVGVV